MPSIIDTFTRSVTDGLGTSDSGHVWSVIENPPNTDVDGSKAIISDSAQWETDLGKKHIFGTVKWRFTAAATGNLNRLYIYVRYAPSLGTGIVYVIEDHSDGHMRCSISRPNLVPLAGETDFAEDMTVDHYAKFEVYRSFYRLKVWKASDPEPFDWLLQTNLEPDSNFGTYIRMR